MTFMQIIFLIVAAVIVGSAVMVVSARRMMHAALWLILSLLGVAVLYGMMEASFFVVVQVMVYIGAIAILIIFAVMLTRRQAEDIGPQIHKNWWVMALAALGLFGVLLGTMSGWGDFQGTSSPLTSPGEEIAALGKSFVSPSGFLIPFEVASVLLLAAMIGAIYIARDRKGE